MEADDGIGITERETGLATGHSAVEKCLFGTDQHAEHVRPSLVTWAHSEMKSVRISLDYLILDERHAEIFQPTDVHLGWIDLLTKSR